METEDSVPGSEDPIARPCAEPAESVQRTQGSISIHFDIVR
jgi:hypothetical protein